MSGDLSCGASGGVRARGAIGGARMRRERDMVGARHRKGARLGQGAEPRGTTDRTSTHTHATPRARSLLHAGAVAVEAATDDARDHARLPTRAEITRECGGVHVTSAQRSADPAMRTLLTYSHVAGRFVVMRARRDEEREDEREERREDETAAKGAHFNGSGANKCRDDDDARARARDARDTHDVRMTVRLRLRAREQASKRDSAATAAARAHG